MSGLSLGPLVEPGSIDDDLTIGSELDLGSIHGPRCGTFKVDPFAVIAAAVTRTLELVLTGLPVGRTAKVSAARVDYEQPVRSAIDPDAVLLLKFGVDAQREFRGIADFENCVGLKKSAGKKESEEREKPRGQECGYAYPG